MQRHLSSFVIQRTEMPHAQNTVASGKVVSNALVEEEEDPSS